MDDEDEFSSSASVTVDASRAKEFEDVDELLGSLSMRRVGHRWCAMDFGSSSTSAAALSASESMSSIMLSQDERERGKVRHLRILTRGYLSVEMVGR